jgi:hypothetical protein
VYRVPFSLATVVIICLFYNSHSNRYEVIYHCHLNLYFYDIKAGEHFKDRSLFPDFILGNFFLDCLLLLNRTICLLSMNYLRPCIFSILVLCQMYGLQRSILSQSWIVSLFCCSFCCAEAF